MPRQVKARAAQDEQEERRVRKLANSHHTPADWKIHARMVVESWANKTPNEIAAQLRCHPQTVRIHLARFNALGIDGLGMRAGSGRKPRLTEQEHSTIIELASQPPPARYASENKDRHKKRAARWNLDTLTCAAHEAGIHVERSQIRRIFLDKGERWHRTHS